MVAREEFEFSGSFSPVGKDVYYRAVCEGMSNEQIRLMEAENALPDGWEEMAYEDFLVTRRKLMAAKIKEAFEKLKANAI